MVDERACAESLPGDWKRKRHLNWKERAKDLTIEHVCLLCRRLPQAAIGKKMGH